MGHGQASRGASGRSSGSRFRALLAVLPLFYLEHEIVASSQKNKARPSRFLWPGTLKR